MQKERFKSIPVFDQIYEEVLSPFFDNLRDDRRNNQSYKLSDALRSGFAIYSLKCPSLFSFRKRSKAENSNLKSIFGIQSIPSDNGLRKILDQVDPNLLRNGYQQLLQWVDQNKYLKDFRYWQNHLLVSLDGVEHFCSKQINCAHCLSRKHRDGSQSYYHSMLSAAIVHPEQRQVLVVDNEPIVKQDGQQKNDCERNAAKRLLKSLQEHHAQQKMVLTMDALYACAPIIKQIQQNKKWRYIINVTDKGHSHLMDQFDQLDELNKVNWKSYKAKDGEYIIAYMNDLSLNASHPELKTNLIYCIWKDNKGEEKIFSWVTNIRLTKGNVMKVMRMGRSRWKIENEVFNTLKNQAYHFEHNFGHGQKHLCTNFALLMMMAFCLDQIQQHVCKIFQTIWTDLKTRIKLWEAIRIVFKLIPVDNMKEIYLNIIDMYQIRLE